MAAPQEFVLYDLATKHNICVSPNVWRVRQVLDFKGIPYKTQFLELPEIAPFGKSVGLAPNQGPEKAYTVPIMQFPGGKYIMHSKQIIEALQEDRPEPVLELGDYNRVRDILSKLMQPLFPVFASEALELFHPVSRAHWKKSVSPPGVDDLEQWLKEQDPKAAWIAAEPAIEELRRVLAQSAGPYIAGAAPSYADMVLAASWKTDEAVCPDVLEELERRIPAVTKHLAACKQWHGKNQ